MHDVHEPRSWSGGLHGLAPSRRRPLPLRGGALPASPGRPLARRGVAQDERERSLTMRRPQTASARTGGRHNAPLRARWACPAWYGVALLYC
jgi:hypothetical protein